jgi:hypothetical protein
MLEIEGKVCIFLSGCTGGPQFVDESNFAAIKSMVINWKELLWITSGSAIDCASP